MRTGVQQASKRYIQPSCFPSIEDNNNARKVYAGWNDTPLNKKPIKAGWEAAVKYSMILDWRFQG